MGRLKDKGKTTIIYAIRKHPDGYIQKGTFGPKSWEALAPITKYDPMGGTLVIPKQGWEQVPEGFSKKAPEPLKTSRKRPSKAAPKVETAEAKEAPEVESEE